MKINNNEINITDKYITFWGSPFSNFYPCEIEYDGIKWKSSEQLFMALKAIIFKDDKIFNAIVNSNSPQEAKKLGRKIKNFNENIWEEHRVAAMLTAVYSKFSQNKDLKEFLLKDEFKNKSFVEGSPIDKIWGVGILYSDESINDNLNWKGLNLLGKILDKVREKLYSEKLFTQIKNQ